VYQFRHNKYVPQTCPWAEKGTKITKGLLSIEFLCALCGFVGNSIEIEHYHFFT
jgi:hypothetical protein